MLVPFVEPVTTFTYNRNMLEFYIKRQHERQHAPLRVNITETLSVVLIREQGEKEYQHEKQEDRRYHHLDVGSGSTQ